MSLKNTSIAHSARWLGAMLFAAFYLILCGGCGPTQREQQDGNSMTPSRSIDTVKEARTSELMSIPGVVGVYVGENDNGIMYIGVMVKKRTPEIERQIPKMLEGYPVQIEETGEIKPLR